MAIYIECECCACTNHNRHTPDSPGIEAEPVNGTAPSPGHLPSTGLDLPKNHQKPSHNNPTSTKQEYPDSEIDAWDWDELEASSPIETFQPIQPLTTLPSTWDEEGTMLDPGHIGPLDQETDPPHNMCPFPFHSRPVRGTRACV